MKIPTRLTAEPRKISANGTTTYEYDTDAGTFLRKELLEITNTKGSTLTTRLAADGWQCPDLFRKERRAQKKRSVSRPRKCENFEEDYYTKIPDDMKRDIENKRKKNSAIAEKIRQRDQEYRQGISAHIDQSRGYIW